MTGKSPEQKEYLQDSLPTTLHLFRFKESQRVSLGNKLHTAEELNWQIEIAKDAQIGYATESLAKIGRLDKLRKELEEDYLLVKSSQVCGLMYLRMYDELYQGWNLEPREFMDFFKMCVRLNCRYWDSLYATEKRFGTEAAYAKDHISGGKLMKSIVTDETRKLYGERGIPPWFKYGEHNWKVFLSNHSLCQFYFKPEPAEYKTVPHYLLPPREPFPEGFLEDNFLIRSDGLPDWLEDKTFEIAPREIAQQEFYEDLRIADEKNKTYESTADQKDYLADNANLRTIKSVARFKRILEEIFPGFPHGEFQDFTEFVIFLRAIAHHEMLDGTPEEILKIPPKELVTRIKRYEKFQEENIRTFTSSQLDKSCVALFLEKKFKEARLMNNATEITRQTSGTLVALLALLDSTQDDRPLRAIRDQNKRTFQILNYDLKPLIYQLPPEAIEHLREFAQVYDDEPIEEIIWEMAEIISRYVSIKHFNLAKPQLPIEKALAEYVKFSHSWIKKNWLWAVEQLENILFRKPQEALSKQVEKVKETEETPTEMQREIVEIKEATQEIQEGALSGWNVLYTDNASSDPKHLHEINGRTTQDRQNAFKQLLREETSIICPIDPESVIRALDWEAGEVPEYVEQIRPRIVVRGEEFKKIKRGAARILYKIDHKVKKLTFFVYKKEGWSYRKI